MKRSAICLLSWAILLSGLWSASGAHDFERLGPSTRRTGLVLSEIMYQPAPHSEGRNLEFLELYNAQDIFEDLSGYRLSGALDFSFPEGTMLAAGEFLVIARVPADVQRVYGISNVIGGYSKGLNNVSGLIRLRHRTGAVLLEVEYGANPPWPAAAAGTGHSLVLARPSFGAQDAFAWAVSARIGGSPGRSEPAVDEAWHELRINEVASHPSLASSAFVELYNRGTHTMDLTGVAISDDAFATRFIIPPTQLEPGRFIAYQSAQLGFDLMPEGGTVFLIAPDRTRIIDAVRYGAQIPGTSWGRTPDGAKRLALLRNQTPAAPNSPRHRPDIVINEIMYHPISDLNADEYVELYNLGMAAVDVSGWKLADGVQFTFPANTIIPVGGYLVVAKNPTRLMANYPELNTGNTTGPFQGSLSNSGERLVLSMPDPQFPRQEIIVADITFGTGGRWGRWSDGGGSSLELIDPRSDSQLAANWADSDESHKAPWTAVEHTGVLDHGTGSADSLQMFLQGAGECLVDNVEVIAPNGINLVPNSTFEGNASGWVAEGSQETSGYEPTEGYLSQGSYQIRAATRGDTTVNRIRTRLSGTLNPSQSATIRAQVRWLRGFPSMLFRLRGNYLEAIGEMSIPRNLGTPGARNSRATQNAGPAIYEVSHAPVLPASGEPVRVTARADDPDEVASLVLWYRVDPSVSFQSVMMTDDGINDDAVAGDGLFTAAIPGQPTGTTVAFYIEAADLAALPVGSRFPNDAPARECLIRFGEVQPSGTFGTYRIWMTQAVYNRWTARNKLNNTPFDVTFVYNDERVIYNAQALFAGSPYISPSYNTPNGALSGYTVTVPKDDLFLGETGLVLDWPGRDDTAIQEQLSYWIAERLDLPYNYRRFIHLHVNGVTDQQRGSIYEDVQQPGSEIINQWVPDDSDGDFYKIERWFEFGDDGRRTADPQPTLQNFTTTGGAKKLARYRWNWLKRATDDVNDYTNIFRLVDAVNAAAPEPYTTLTESLADIEQWMRIFATEHIINNFDSYGHTIGKNMYAYKPENGKWLLFMFDIDWVMKESAGHGLGPTAPLFDAYDPVITRMYQHPPFRRAYFRAVQDAVTGPLLSANINPVMDAKHAVLVANGVTRSAGRTLVPPSAVKQWIAQRRAYLVQQLQNVAAEFAVTSIDQTEFSTSDSPVLLSGTAPVEIKTIRFNGVIRPITWNTTTTWSVAIDLQEGANTLHIQGFDAQGLPLGSAEKTLRVHFTGTDATAGVAVWINEWMASNSSALANPATGQFDDWFELYNPNETPVDLSRFTLTDNLANWPKFIIPPGTVIAPNGYLLVWADGQPDLGPDLHTPFKLDQAGEQLGLFAPNGRLIDSVTFGPQVTDVSEGRWPNGGSLVVRMNHPTPGAANQGGAPAGELRLLQIQVTDSGTVTLTFHGEPNQTYRVQFTDSLSSPIWQDVAAPLAAPDSSLSFTDPTLLRASARFYRVLVE